MVNTTIVEGLRPYALGEKLRTLRLRKSMGLVELGQTYGSFVSDALKTGTREAVSYVAHTTSYCNGVRCRA